MVGTNFATAGDGKLHSLKELNYRSDGQLVQVTVICGSANLKGVANVNGVAIGCDNELVTWLAAGDSTTFLTRRLGDVVWQDLSGAATVLGIFIETPQIVVVAS